MVMDIDLPEASGAAVFGLWCDRDQDALAMQQVLRNEWTRRCSGCSGSVMGCKWPPALPTLRLGSVRHPYSL